MTAWTQNMIHHLLDYLAEMDPVWAPVAFMLFCAVSVILMFPSSLLMMTAGFLYGAVWGVVCFSVASIFGASATFLIARYLARDWVKGKMETRPKFEALDRAMGKKGAKIVFLLRICPIFPYAVLNYGLGVSRISFREYVKGSWLGMLPTTMFFASIGASIKDVAEMLDGGREKSLGEWVFLGCALLVGLCVLLYMARFAQRAMGQAMKNSGEGDFKK